jgi:predicted nuclease of predicted toxin-antitoxin system
MRFKLDQNLDRGIAQPLLDAGHDLTTAEEQSLQRADDPTIAHVCRTESRCLITADLGFAQIIDYPPDQYPGLIVVRHPHPTRSGMRALFDHIRLTCVEESPVGRLWIVEPGRIRIHLPTTPITDETE